MQLNYFKKDMIVVDEVQSLLLCVVDARDHRRNHSSGGVRWTGLLYGPKTGSDRMY